MAERKRDLQLATGDPEECAAAAEAVRHEYKFSSRARVMHCRQVRAIEDDLGLYCLVVGDLSSADWTWEGAVAMQLDDGMTEGEGGGFSGVRWKGEVIEVDDVGGELYVVASGTSAPEPGPFLLKPFEFLGALDAAYSGDGADLRTPLLAASLGAAVGRPAGGALPAEDAVAPLNALWSWSWATLWGPPGTGKTHSVGRQIASTLLRTDERVLVVSTTNRATDVAALAVGRSLRDADPEYVFEGRVLRPGAGAEIAKYEEAGLGGMLPGDVHEMRRRLARLRVAAARARGAEERAILSADISALRKLIQQASTAAFCDPDIRGVVCTSYTALCAVTSSSISELLAQGQAPFDTVVVDEAGLVSRAAAAAISLLAAKRFVLVGDPRQLAPIAKVSRVISAEQARWLAESGLAHLSVSDVGRAGVHLLEEQHRMAPAVRALISAYQYEGRLRDGDTVRQRALAPRGGALFDLSRGPPAASWYVLDEEPGEPHQIRAERGPGGRSWVRRKSLEVLDRLFQAQPELRQADGLFLTPYRAQAQAAHRWLVENGVSTWMASTVHRQQGAEADHVVFDTVHAGSTGWPPREWERLVNVALSRARETVLVIASRDEMEESYLSPLAELLSPGAIRRGAWYGVDRRTTHQVSAARRGVPGLLGTQLDARRSMRPLMSAEQERLCQLPLDSGPRLVRGVAGSGKTVVLARWLARTLADMPDQVREPVWVVYGNVALAGLLDASAREAWRSVAGDRAYPLDRVELWHVGMLLEHLGRHYQVSLAGIDRYDYDGQSGRIVDSLGATRIAPVAHAGFIDEAQDFGPRTLELITALVRRADPADPRSQPVRVFYDNAQNLYRRGTPNWARLGLDMRGRSTVMKESFRGTRPVAEFALNVLFRLSDAASDPDHRELVQRGLIERRERNGRPWWRVDFVRVDGPVPTLHIHPDRVSELESMARQVRSWVVDAGVRPCDIRVITNGESQRREAVAALQRVLAGTGTDVLEQRSERFTSQESTVVVTTAHSFKGHDAEVVCVAGCEAFATGGDEILFHALYVALTRARSVLRVSAVAARAPVRARIVRTLEEVAADMKAVPALDDGRRHGGDLEHVISVLGDDHADWVREIWERYAATSEPLVDDKGEVFARPVFWFSSRAGRHAVFAGAVSDSVRQSLGRHDVRVMAAGERLLPA